jgi:hypothetical protein
MEVFDDLRAKLRNLERKAVRSPTMSPAWLKQIDQIKAELIATVRLIEAQLSALALNRFCQHRPARYLRIATKWTFGFQNCIQG